MANVMSQLNFFSTIIFRLIHGFAFYIMTSLKLSLLICISFIVLDNQYSYAREIMVPLQYSLDYVKHRGVTPGFAKQLLDQSGSVVPPMDIAYQQSCAGRGNRNVMGNYILVGQSPSVGQDSHNTFTSIKREIQLTHQQTGETRSITVETHGMSFAFVGDSQETENQQGCVDPVLKGHAGKYYGSYDGAVTFSNKQGDGLFYIGYSVELVDAVNWKSGTWVSKFPWTIARGIDYDYEGQFQIEDLDVLFTLNFEHDFDIYDFPDNVQLRMEQGVFEGDFDFKVASTYSEMTILMMCDDAHPGCNLVHEDKVSGAIIGFKQFLLRNGGEADQSIEEGKPIIVPLSKKSGSNMINKDLNIYMRTEDLDVNAVSPGSYRETIHFIFELPSNY